MVILYDSTADILHIGPLITMFCTFLQVFLGLLASVIAINIMLSTCYQGIIVPWDYNIPFSDRYIKCLNNIKLYIKEKKMDVWSKSRGFRRYLHPIAVWDCYAAPSGRMLVPWRCLHLRLDTSLGFKAAPGGCLGTAEFSHLSLAKIFTENCSHRNTPGQTVSLVRMCSPVLCGDARISYNSSLK